MNKIKQKAYILRMWREQEQTRYALINPDTGWRRSFADLPAFIQFLSETQPCVPHKKARNKAVVRDSRNNPQIIQMAQSQEKNL